MTGIAARIASAVSLASLLPITANAGPAVDLAAASLTAGSTGRAIQHNAGCALRHDDVAADKTTLFIKLGDSFDCAVGAALPAQITR